MSGPICPDCGSFDIEPQEEIDSCPFCGWKGPARPRRSLTPETQHRLAEQNRVNRKAKEAGRLYFVRIVGSSIDDLEALIDQLKDLLGPLDRPQVVNAEEPYIFMKLGAMPDRAVMEKIRSLHGVAEVTTH